MAEEKEQLKDKIAKLSALSISSERKEEMVREIVKPRLKVMRYLFPAGAVAVLAFLIVATTAGPSVSPNSNTRNAGTSELDFVTAEENIDVVHEDLSEDFATEEAELEAIESDVEEITI